MKIRVLGMLFALSLTAPMALATGQNPGQDPGQTPGHGGHG